MFLLVFISFLPKLSLYLKAIIESSFDIIGERNLLSLTGFVLKPDKKGEIEYYSFKI